MSSSPTFACTSVSFMRATTARRSSGRVARLKRSSKDRRKPSNTMGRWLGNRIECTIRDVSAATQQSRHRRKTMTSAPFVLVTATTEVLRERSRVRVNEAYTSALSAAGLVPLVLPPIDPLVAIASLTDVAGLVLTGGEDVDPEHFGQTAHAETSAPHARR